MCNAQESLIKKMILSENIYLFIYFFYFINMKSNHYDSYLLKFIMIVYINEILNMKLDNLVVINKFSL